MYQNASSWHDLVSFQHESIVFVHGVAALPYLVRHWPLWKKHWLQANMSISILYIYIKLKKLLDNPRIYWRNNAKTGNQRKLRKWREQMHPICCYSSSENINCHSIQTTRKKHANNLKRALDFYYYSPFLYGNISVCNIWGTCKC